MKRAALPNETDAVAPLLTKRYLPNAIALAAGNSIFEIRRQAFPIANESVCIFRDELWSGGLAHERASSRYDEHHISSISSTSRTASGANVRLGNRIAPDQRREDIITAYYGFDSCYLAP